MSVWVEGWRLSWCMWQERWQNLKQGSNNENGEAGVYLISWGIIRTWWLVLHRFREVEIGDDVSWICDATEMGMQPVFVLFCSFCFCLARMCVLIIQTEVVQFRISCYHAIKTTFTLLPLVFGSSHCLDWQLLFAMLLIVSLAHFFPVLQCVFRALGF